jgi:Rad3-related DNA helicase
MLSSRLRLRAARKLVLQVCPFYATKDLAPRADIVFMPYNYVTQELSTTPDLVKDTIIIFDEAHNIENACQDTASFDLTSGEAPMLRCCK